jgi:SAM-dependent methyltransferase
MSGHFLETDFWMKGMLSHLFQRASLTNQQNILSLLEGDRETSFIDLGCGDGRFTAMCARRLRNDLPVGVELDKKEAKKARSAGIGLVRCDLNTSFPFKNDSFGVIVSTQVIEHLMNVDLFVEEMHRTLRKGGYAIISTENLSSWHNIFALILGYRPFSQDYSSRIKVGNPLSPHHEERLAKNYIGHIRVFTYQALCDLFRFYRFKIEEIAGAGYYPIGSNVLMRFFSKLDPRHAHFLTMKLRKYDRQV